MEDVFILLIEDNDADFKAIDRAFTKTGMPDRVKRFPTAEEALSFLNPDQPEENENNSPRLILLDLNLPGMDGFQFLKTIKEDESTRSIPVLIFTTSNSEEDVRKCYEYGANGYVKKPLDVPKLYQTIEVIKEYWLETSVMPVRNG